MTLELFHLYIKKGLIRAFALADEWIDRAFDQRTSRKKSADNAIHLLTIMISENEYLLSSIGDYRFSEAKEKQPLEEHQLADKSEFIYQLIRNSNIIPNEENDLHLLRSRLRDLLLECLLLLDLADESKECEVTLNLEEQVNITISELCQLICRHLIDRINQLESAQKDPVK